MKKYKIVPILFCVMPCLVFSQEPLRLSIKSKVSGESYSTKILQKRVLETGAGFVGDSPLANKKIFVSLNDALIKAQSEAVRILGDGYKASSDGEWVIRAIELKSLEVDGVIGYYRLFKFSRRSGYSSDDFLQVVVLLDGALCPVRLDRE